MPRQAPKLSEKHWKALELIADGKMSLKDVAIQLGWAPNDLYRLYEGDTDKMGKTALLFQSEVKRITAKNVSKIKDLIRDNKVKALRMIDGFLSQKMMLEYQSDADMDRIVSIFNALAKATPSIEINSTSYSYVKGLSAEELMYEFNKLKSIAEGTPSRGIDHGNNRTGTSISNKESLGRYLQSDTDEVET